MRARSVLAGSFYMADALGAGAASMTKLGAKVHQGFVRQRPHLWRQTRGAMYWATG